ncbi:prepilin-type N-terminal cleavage/methylation domain-containing protein [Salmonella enterica subsp. enterica serovar 4,[5],12:b:-]|nr:prepilin-type N-terminal cleavage/methylation domain-containing protein [Salmonella enterica subsp. enterica serovar 4,[5],12:b:-]
MSSVSYKLRNVFLSLSAGNKKTGEQDKGLTLLEILLAIVVIAVVIGYVYRQYSSVQTSVQSGGEQNNILTIIANMKQLKYQGRYTDSNYISTLYKQGLLPSDMIADASGTTAKNPWGGTVTISPSSDKYSFSVQETKVPMANCMSMVNALRSSSAITKINNTSTSSVDAATICNSDSNTLTFSTDS